MDRLAAHVVATALLTAALAAVPVAIAKPTSQASTFGAALPAPTGSPTLSATVPTKPNATATPTATTPKATAKPSETPMPKPTATKPALVPIPCPDAYQVGATAFARWHGMIAFSVKQFYSPTCHTVYGYAYPWLQFRELKQQYDLGMAVFDLTHDAIMGARTFVNGVNGPDFWSAPYTPAAGTCTQGLAHVFFPDTETDTFTVKFCL